MSAIHDADQETSRRRAKSPNVDKLRARRARIREPATVTAPAPPDPIDLGALLRDACAAHHRATGETPRALALRAGIEPSALYRAFTRRNASPETARPVLLAMGKRVEIVCVTPPSS